MKFKKNICFSETFAIFKCLLKNEKYIIIISADMNNKNIYKVI